jgi:organic hydroperoxide reductase OsmC/OhrA
MSDYFATVEWKADGGFRDGSYSRVHAIGFDGGVEIKGSSSPHVVAEPMSDPKAVDPEELLVASAASCHMLWFLHLARDAGFDVAAYRDAPCGTMARDADGWMAITRIALHPKIDFAGPAPDADALARLHHDAHALCYIANSLKSEIVVEA